MSATIKLENKHFPVLLKELISIISPLYGGTFLDCTFGQGGYSKKILEKKINKVIDPRPGEIMFGLNMVVSKGKTIFIGDTSVHEYPSSVQMAEIAMSAARVVRLFGFNPKVAFLSHSTFGQPITSRTKHIRDAVDILKQKKVDFKFDGDMQPDVALDDSYSELYPFSEIVGKANILIMPGQHSAAISYKIMKSLGGAKVIGLSLITF